MPNSIFQRADMQKIIWNFESLFNNQKYIESNNSTTIARQFLFAKSARGTTTGRSKALLPSKAKNYSQGLASHQK